MTSVTILLTVGLGLSGPKLACHHVENIRVFSLNSCSSCNQ